MNKTKYIARLLAVVMIISLLPPEVFAQSQNPVKKIIDIIVGHTKSTNNNTIIPNVNITWSRPEENESGDKLTHYVINAKDYSDLISGTLSHVILAGNSPQVSYQIGARDTGISLKNGVLYELDLKARHIEQGEDGQSVTHDSPVTPESRGYFITDFDTELESNKDQLELTWEHIPGVEYEIAYAQGDYGNIDEFPKDGVTKYTLKSDQIKDLTYMDENTGRMRVKYIIGTNVILEQAYSAYVIPKIPANHPLSSEKVYIGNKPKVAVTTTEVELKVSNIGNGFIRLEWNIEPSIMAGKYRLKESKVFAQPDGGQPYLVFTFKGENGKLGYYEMYEPQKPTHFWLEFTFESDDENKEVLEPKPTTNKVLYTPYSMMEKPLSPQIPKPANKDTEFNKENINEYVVKGDDIAYNSPSLLSHTFHMKGFNPLQIQLIWGAPTIKDKEGNSAVDYDLTYDIWVTDDKDKLNQKNLDPLVEDFSVLPFMTGNQIRNQQDEVVGFSRLLETYYDINGDIKELQSNKTYYIKILAKRAFGDIYMKSDPTVVTITIGKNGDIFIPPILGKPPLQLDTNGLTTNSADIKWLEEWYEITAREPNEEQYPDEAELYLAGLWNSRVFTGNTYPAINFKLQKESVLTEHILRTLEDVRLVESVVNEKTGEEQHFIHNYISRKVTLGEDVKYELKVTPYEDIKQQLNGQDISVWIQENESDSKEGWDRILPQKGKDEEGLEWQEYTIKDLDPNTSYVAMIRAYRELEDGSILNQTYPSYLIFTTLPDYESPETVPTVPNLNFHQKTNTSISVWWDYNSDFEYEILYGRTDDIEKAKKWSVNISDNYEDENYLEDGSRSVITIQGLFPDTSYNIWIRAKQKIGNKVSAWSNPLTAKTDDVKAPDVPAGLGAAAYQSILELGLDFNPISSDYITVEWMLNRDDVGTEVEGSIEKSYEYELEFSDTVEFLDVTTVIINDKSVGTVNDKYEILAKNMVRFKGLDANRPYYVRVKARIIVTDIETKHIISKESEQSRWVKIITKTSEDEYDGGENDNIVIYPNNIEESYENYTWTLEIVNEQGIISEILNQKKYYFTIDMTLYNDRHDAEIRKVRIPKSVLNAIAGQNMELRVMTNIGKYEIKPQTLNHYLQNTQAKDVVEFEFKTVWAYDAKEYAKSYPYTMLKGEELNIYIKGNNLPVTKLDGMMKVSTKLHSQSNLSYNGIEAYVYSQNSGSWVKQPKTIEQIGLDNYFSYTTPLIGIYATYKVENYADSSLSYDMKTLAKQYGIHDLGTQYTRYSVVHSDQYINLLLGIAKNNPNIKLTGAPSIEAKKQAKSSGIYTEDYVGYLTEEQVVSGIVKLYELKMGYSIKPSSKKFQGVSSKYSENIAKAYAVGIIEDINPNKQVSYEKLCKWLINAGF